MWLRYLLSFHMKVDTMDDVTIYWSGLTGLFGQQDGMHEGSVRGFFLRPVVAEAMPVHKGTLEPLAMLFIFYANYQSRCSWPLSG